MSQPTAVIPGFAFGRQLPTGGAGPESILPIVVMDSGLVLRAPRNDDSMPEMPHAGEHHGDAVVVGGLDHFVVADRSAGLDHGGGAGFDRD